MDPKPEMQEAAPATVTAASETTSETTEASATAGASAMVPPWQNIGHESLETILKNAGKITAACVDAGMRQDKVDAAARAIAERLAIAAVLDGIEHIRKRAKSAVINRDEMLDEIFPAFRRKSSGHKQPKRAKKATETPTDKAAKNGGGNA